MFLGKYECSLELGTLLSRRVAGRFCLALECGEYRYHTSLVHGSWRRNTSLSETLYEAQFEIAKQSTYGFHQPWVSWFGAG
jgi:hypothetical protein